MRRERPSVTLLSLRERCHPCGEKHVLSSAEANLLLFHDPRLIKYLCPVGHGWHIDREDDPERRGQIDYEP